MAYVMPINRNQLPIQSLRFDNVVGIDPDLKGSGWAVWSNVKNAFTQIQTVQFWEFINLVNEFKPGKVLFVIDAGWKNEATNFHKVYLPENIKRASPATQAKYTASVREKVARDVGLNSGVGLSMVNYLQGQFHNYIEARPQTHKWDKETIARETGYTGKSNPETRDAIRDAWQYRNHIIQL
ncbi:hypothetical protein [Spirosoma litoris]